MQDQVYEKLLEIVKPFAKNKEAFEKATESSSFLDDLEVSSSRLVDIVLDIEEAFEIEVADTEADKIDTLGSAVALIKAKTAGR
ncbi:MAG: phosphopantetheine-binding protein [Bdellovibrionota bacterium]|nr:MAG: phosphopantetheine-binding protein [Bdellovibrionota bacterium]